MIKKVFLDIDGVLADFYGGVRKRFNYNGEFKSYKLWEDLKVSKDVFYSAISDSFYKDLKKTPYADKLVEYLEYEFGKWNICFITSTINCKISGKLDWISRNFPFYFKNKRYLLGNCKSVVANSEHLLIDDNKFNVNRFIKSGGHSVCFSSEFNLLTDNCNPIDYIKGQISILKVDSVFPCDEIVIKSQYKSGDEVFVNIDCGDFLDTYRAKIKRFEGVRFGNRSKDCYQQEYWCVFYDSDGGEHSGYFRTHDGWGGIFGSEEEAEEARDQHDNFQREKKEFDY